MTKFKRIRTEKILQRCIKSHLLLLCLIYSMFRKLYETGKGSLDFRHVAVFVFPPINYSVDVLLYKIWRDIKIDVATMMRGVATNIWWLIGIINVAYYRFVLLMHLIISGNGYWRVVIWITLSLFIINILALASIRKSITIQHWHYSIVVCWLRENLVS